MNLFDLQNLDKSKCIFYQWLNFNWKSKRIQDFYTFQFKKLTLSYKNYQFCFRVKDCRLSGFLFLDKDMSSNNGLVFDRECSCTIFIGHPELFYGLWVGNKTYMSQQSAWPQSNLIFTKSPTGWFWLYGFLIKNWWSVWEYLFYLGPFQLFECQYQSESFK